MCLTCLVCSFDNDSTKGQKSLTHVYANFLSIKIPQQSPQSHNPSFLHLSLHLPPSKRAERMTGDIWSLWSPTVKLALGHGWSDGRKSQTMVGELWGVGFLHLLLIRKEWEGIADPAMRTQTDLCLSEISGWNSVHLNFNISFSLKKLF